MNLLKLFDPDATCPKCGYREVHSYYCKGGYFPWKCTLTLEGEHLHRYCRRCKFEWAEKCLGEGFLKLQMKEGTYGNDGDLYHDEGRSGADSDNKEEKDA